MSIGMGVTDPKFVKGGRKLKKTKHCIIPKTLKKKMKSEKASKIRKRSPTLIQVNEKINTEVESM